MLSVCRSLKNVCEFLPFLSIPLKCSPETAKTKNAMPFTSMTF